MADEPQEEPHKSKIESFDPDIPVSIGGDCPGDIFDVWAQFTVCMLGLYAIKLGHPFYGSAVMGIGIVAFAKLFIWDTLIVNYVERIRIKWTSKPTSPSTPQPTPTSPKSSDVSPPIPNASPSTPAPSENSSV